VTESLAKLLHLSAAQRHGWISRMFNTDEYHDMIFRFFLNQLLINFIKTITCCFFKLVFQIVVNKNIIGMKQN